MSLIFNLHLTTATATTGTKFAIFDSGFLITVAIIVLSTLIIAFIHHLKKDKCIKNFRTDIVTVYFNDGKSLKGRFDVENTGCELIADTPGDDIKYSFIIYKDEYPNVRFFVRHHDDLDENRLKRRKKVMRKTYHPSPLRRFGRRVSIFFKIVRDSMMEIFSVLSGKIKTTSTSYASSEKYIANVNKEAVTSIDTTHNPLLEKYIGNIMVCSHLYNGKVYEIRGILKDYTGEYIELLDVEFETENLKITNADIILPRTVNKIRSLGEDSSNIYNDSRAFNLNLYKKSVKKSSYEKNQKDKIKK